MKETLELHTKTIADVLMRSTEGFTVAQICEQTGLPEAQVRRVLSALVLNGNVNERFEARPERRGPPPRVYSLADLPGMRFSSVPGDAILER